MMSLSAPPTASVHCSDCSSSGLLRDRASRVMMLVMMIVILSLADLVLTLFHLTTTGMMEANPIARFVIRSTNSPLALSLFKTSTVCICIAVLYQVREHRCGELAAWLSIVILLGMCLMWVGYTAATEGDPELVQLAQVAAQHEQTAWVAFE